MKTPFQIDIVAKQVYVYFPKMLELRGQAQGEWLTLSELRQLVRDIKNSVKAFAGVTTHKFVCQSKSLNAFFESNEFASAVRCNDPVNDAASVANGKTELASTTAPRAGFIFENGRYVLVAGERVYAVDDLILHGALSDDDANLAAYMMRYLAKTVELVA